MSLKVIPNVLLFKGVEEMIYSGSSVELKVKGSSMHPTLVNGKHKVVLEPFNQKYLRIGMIALIVYNKKHILHRLVARKNNMLIFRGDNLPYTKEIVQMDDIRAFVGYIITPRGKIVDCKKRRYVMLSRLFVPLNMFRFIIMKQRNRIANVLLTRHNI